MKRVLAMGCLLLAMRTPGWAGDWQHATSEEAFKTAFVGISLDPQRGSFRAPRPTVFDCESDRMEHDWVLADLRARDNPNYRDDEGASVFHRVHGAWTYVSQVGGRGGAPQKEELTKLGIPPDVRARLGYGDVPAAVCDRLKAVARPLGHHFYAFATYGPKVFAETRRDQFGGGNVVVWEHVGDAWRKVFQYNPDVDPIDTRFRQGGFSRYMEGRIVDGSAASGQF